MQISCQQAGEPTPNAWTVIHEQDSGADLDISDWLGIDKNPGELIAQIQNTSGEHSLPVDTLVLIGLPAFIEYYHSGDGLITYAGQRFSNTWKNSKIQKTPSSFGNGYVAERILGVSNYDPDAVPDAKPSSDLIARWFDNNSFRGYFHSTAVPEYINILRQGAAEAKVVSSSNIGGTNEPHAALTEIKAWLKPAEPAEPLNVTLNLQVVNVNTQQPVAGAEVYFNANGTSCSSSAERYGVTDASGKLTKELPFYPLSKYTALVIAAGYKAGEFDTGYQTGFTPGLSGTDFGTIKLQAGKVPTVTSATGRVWMDRNLGASRVATSSSWDEQAHGDIYQWGRLADGHQKLINFTKQLSTTDAPGHDQYICMSLDYYYTDWRIPKNDNFWQGVNGINNPCPTGFRLPTANEWQSEIDTWISKDAAGAFASPLKLTSSDRVHILCTSIRHWADWAYWSSTIQGDYAAMLTPNGIEYTFRASGHPVRCIKDEVEQVPTVVSATGRVWMDRNLGASRVATSMTDTAAYGDLYQWGRLADGHEKRTSSTTNTSSSSDVPGHGNHIIRSDWRIPQNNNLWQGLNGTNNPCPSGFRLPTANEWQEEIDSWSFKNSTGAFTSPLKLVAAGYRSFLDGLIRVDGYPAQYWTSSIINSPYPDWYVSQEVSFDIWGASAGGDGMNRGAAMSVRCIKD